jgi:hypothetical protein
VWGESLDTAATDVPVTRWFKYDWDKLWLVYTQIVPVIFEPPCILWMVECGGLVESGAQIPSTRSLWRLSQYMVMPNICGSSAGTFFISPFWRLSLSGVSQIFGQFFFTHAWNDNWQGNPD